MESISAVNAASFDRTKCVFYTPSMTVQISERQLKTMVRESVREELRHEFMNLRSALAPFVTEREAKDIAVRYKKPSRRIVKTSTITL